MLNWRRPVLVAGLRLINPVTFNELAVLRKLEFAGAEAVRSLHEQRLAALLRHAWRTTDYYRQVLAETGVVWGDGAVDLSRFADIPFLTKDIIRDEFDRLTSRALPKGRRPYLNSSGGSTGQPVRFLQDSSYWDANIATRLSQFRYYGKELGDRELKIWGSEYDLIKGLESLASRAKSWLYNRRSEQCFSLPEARIREIVHGINQFKPKTIFAYRDGIDVVAQYVNRHGLEVHRPAAIFCGGGTIYEHIVASIEQAFHAPVVSIYGSREMGAIACQCPQRGGLHVSMNSHRVEAIDKNEQPVLDEEGELAVTSLHNYAMPFIRYRIGDRAAALSKPCPCGRNSPMLGTISGRVVETLVNAQGDKIDGLFVIHLIGVVAATEGYVRRFQVVQEAPDQLIINMILDQGATPDSVRAKLTGISEKIRLLMGAKCHIDYRFVDEIPLTSSGKHPYVVRMGSARDTAVTAIRV